jgi:hypothetical protein
MRTISLATRLESRGWAGVEPAGDMAVGSRIPTSGTLGEGNSMEPFPGQGHLKHHHGITPRTRTRRNCPRLPFSVLKIWVDCSTLSVIINKYKETLILSQRMIEE